MKSLKDLLTGIEYITNQTIDLMKVEIVDITADSRKVVNGCIFVCMPNPKAWQYTCEAIQKGAIAVVTSQDEQGEVVTIHVKDSRSAYTALCRNFFEQPDQELTIIGVTGTKGKTSTAYFVRELLERSYFECGLISTNEIILPREHQATVNTTPDAYIIFKALRDMVQAGWKYAVIETSSQGFLYHRTDGIHFRIGILTNIEEDHIGPLEHKNFDEYIQCKAVLFQNCDTCIMNENVPVVDELLKDTRCKRVFYGYEPFRRREATYYAGNVMRLLEVGKPSLCFEVEGPTKHSVKIDNIGVFHAANAVAAIAAVEQLGIRLPKSIHICADIKGRMQVIRLNDIMVVIDYAHNAFSLGSALASLRDYVKGRIICVFGCGGNRDVERRVKMGEVSGRLADVTILTDDNPRFEDPELIIQDIESGLQKTLGRYLVVRDRRKAIETAIQMASKGDFILLAGKGHETYQEIRGVRYPMSEEDIVNECKELR